MLQDRYYMRRPNFRGVWSATVSLLVLNACAFFLQLLLAQRNPLAVFDYLALSTAGLRHGYVWQLLTYQVLHGGFIHLLCNSLAIFVFGRDVEEALGRKSFYTLYFTSGIIGGLCQALAGVFLGGRFAAPVVGASAGAFGLTAAFALLFPERLLLFLFFVPIQARYLLLLSAVVAVL